MVELPLEPIYKETIVGASAQSERERNARNSQLKMNWPNKCQRLIEVGIMCGDKPWSLADRKTVEHFYGKLKELAENCDFENKEETRIRDVFMSYLIDPEIQKELLKQTVEPRQALELAIKWNSECGINIRYSSTARSLFLQMLTPFISTIIHENRIGKTRTMFQNKTIDRHSIAQTVVELGSQIIVKNVLQSGKIAGY